jgi:hypothetical protein
MCYPDESDYIQFLFQRLQDFEVATDSKQPNKPGRSKAYTDASLIVFFAIMTLKGLNEFRVQHRWLIAHPLALCTLKLKKIPSRMTLLRRYKALSPKLAEFITFLGDWATPLGNDFSREVVYQDKNLFKRACLAPQRPRTKPSAREGEKSRPRCHVV